MNGYFEDTNGRIACEKHIGNYGQAALEKKPNVKRIQTPITVWIRLTDADIEEIKGFNPHVCETCYSNNR